MKLLSNLKNALSLLATPLPKKARQLSESPLYLLMFCLLVNSLSFPYLGFQHDSLFYLAAALPDGLERIGAASPLLPAVQLLKLLISIIGAKLTFFIFYIGSKALLFSALIALVQHFYRGSLSFLAVVLLCCLQWPYSGYGIFQLNESFFTPRLPAIALAIWSLVYFLRGYNFASVLAGILCFALHPLYGCYCLGFYIFMLALGKEAGLARSLALCLILPLLSIIGYYTFSELPIFQLRDSEHLQLLFLRSAYYFLPLFDARDISIFAILLFLNISLIPLLPELRRILLSSFLLSLSAILGSTISYFLPLEFLFLAQPIRACFLAIPLCVILSLSALQQGLPGPKKFLVLAILCLVILGASFSTLAFVFVLIWLAVLVLTGRRLWLAFLLCVSFGFGFLNAHFPETNAGRKQRIQATEQLAPHIPAGSTVYWPGMLEEIWVGLAAESYFSIDQMAPLIYSSRVADTFKSRIPHVAPFEQQYSNLAEQNGYSGRFMQSRLSPLKLPLKIEDPFQVRDLKAALQVLCEDPLLDFVILPERVTVSMKEVSPDLFIQRCQADSRGE